MQASPDFWNDQDQSQKLVRELKGLRHVVEPVRSLQGGFEEVDLLLEMAEEGGELEEVAGELDATLEGAKDTLDDLEFKVMLGGPSDQMGAYLQISAGAGGVDACDWASMLMRMYVRWAETRGFDLTRSSSPRRTWAGSAASRCRSRGPTPSATSRPRPACTGSCASAPSTPRPAARRRSRRWT